MKEINAIIMKNIRLKIIVSVALLILLIPLIAMQFSDQVNWTLIDFIVGGGLLLGAGLILEVILRKLNQSKYKGVIIATLFIVLLLIWAELAVGIFGSPFAGS